MSSLPLEFRKKDKKNNHAPQEKRNNLSPSAQAMLVFLLSEYMDYQFSNSFGRLNDLISERYQRMWNR